MSSSARDMGLSSRGNFIDSGMEAYHWSSWNSSSPTALVRSERLCSACTAVRGGMGRGECTVHAVEDAIFYPSHGDFAEVEVPSFFFLSG